MLSASRSRSVEAVVLIVICVIAALLLAGLVTFVVRRARSRS
jgi:hypothetical protein